MEKKALIVYGKSGQKDNLRRFQRDTKINLELIEEIANSQGYSVNQTPLNRINDFLIGENYFKGHANKRYLGHGFLSTNDILSKIGEFNGKSLIVLDCCAGDYKGGWNFEALNLPKNSKIVGAREVCDDKSLAKILYDIIILRKNNLENLNKKMFEEVKHNWVYFKETK
jgi:hypothetical protein